MKQQLKNHPIVTAWVLGILLAIAMAVLSIGLGRQYYYRIYNDGSQISDVQIQEYSNDGTPLHLLELNSVEYGEDDTIVYFNSVHPGSGILSISYTQLTPDGKKIEMFRNTSLLVSQTKIIYIGEGIYNNSGISVIHIGISIYSLLMILYFVWRRKEITKTNRYSYAYMSTWSGQLFFSGIFLIYAITAVASLLWFSYIDVYLMSAVTRYLMLGMTAISFPFVFIFAVSMTISNISLIRHEGKRLNNMLGIIVGVGMLCAIVVIAVLFVLFLIYGRDSALIAVLYSVSNSLYIVFLSVLYGAIISGLQAGHHKPSMEKDFIIILGCAIRKDGTLYPLIRGRVDRAIEFWREQEAKTGKKAVFVPSGGKGSDEIISEGEAMQRYLLEQGISEEYILIENQSTTTYENMLFSKKLIDSIDPSARIAFSTTNYHVLRSGILAGKAGVDAEGMGAATKWYFWPNALLREVAGMFAYQPKTQIVTMLLLALLAGAAGYAYALFL